MEPTDTQLSEIAVRHRLQEVPGVMAALRDAWLAGRQAVTRRRARAGRPPWRDTPAGAAAIARIVALRADGLSYLTIARQLEAEGVPTAEGGPWGTSMVHALHRQALMHAGPPQAH